jgi:hypothetical protein
MDIATIWKLIGLGLEVDLEKRTYSIKLGPLTIKGLSFKTVKALSASPQAIEGLLSEQFVQREVMFADFRREEVGDCIASLRELQELCKSQASAFAATKKSEDEVFSTVLRAWANECDEAANSLESALRDENDPADSGMDTSARSSIPRVIGKLRTATFPSVEMFIDLLPEGNPVKAQATEKLTAGKDVLVKYFNVQSSEILRPDFEPQGP